MTYAPALICLFIGAWFLRLTHDKRATAYTLGLLIGVVFVVAGVLCVVLPWVGR